MTHTLMDLPFDENALEPYISTETLQYHHSLATERAEHTNS